MSSFRPYTCLHCNYDLTGLPSGYDCPECGEPFDEYARVWRITRRRRHTVADLVFPVVGIVFLGPLAVYYVGRAPFNPVTLIVTFAVLVCILSIFKTLKWKGIDRFSAIAPTGLLIRLENTVLWIPWNRVVEVRVIWRGTYVKYVSRRLGKPFPMGIVLRRVFESRAEALEFCQAVRAGKLRYEGP